MARLYGRLLASLGVLPGTSFVGTARADLVAGYMGGRRHVDFGQEAIETLLKLMEDHHTRSP